MKLLYAWMLGISMIMVTMSHAMQNNPNVTAPISIEEDVIFKIINDTATQEEINSLCQACPELAPFLQGYHPMGMILKAVARIALSQSSTQNDNNGQKK